MRLLEHLRDLHRNDPALVIGNGRSRLGSDLNALSAGYITFGCNALYRDFAPDYLFAIDDKMIDEILGSGYLFDLFVRYDANVDHGCQFGRLIGTTGNAALYASLIMGCDPITLIGFDGCLVDGHQQNNVYAMTVNYETINREDEIAEIWTDEFHQLLEEFPDRRVISLTPTPYLV